MLVHLEASPVERATDRPRFWYVHFIYPVFVPALRHYTYTNRSRFCKEVPITDLATITNLLAILWALLSKISKRAFIFGFFTNILPNRKLYIPFFLPVPVDVNAILSLDKNMSKKNLVYPKRKMRKVWYLPNHSSKKKRGANRNWKYHWNYYRRPAFLHQVKIHININTN